MLQTARDRAHNKSLREAFVNEEGAVDLASIMVGIIVIGIIGGVIAATVFAIIPWSQDNAAKGALDSVATAESAYRGFEADAGRDAFGNGGDLQERGLLNSSDYPDLSITNDDDPSTDGPDYQAVIKSASGKYFVSTNGASAAELPVTVEPGGDGDNGGGDDGGGEAVPEGLIYGPEGTGNSVGAASVPTTSNLDFLQENSANGLASRAAIDAAKAQNKQGIYWAINASSGPLTPAQSAGLPDLSNEMFFEDENGEYSSEFYLNRYGNPSTITTTDGTVYEQVGSSDDLRPADQASKAGYNDRLKIFLNPDKTVKSISLDYFGIRGNAPYKTYTQMQAHLKGATVEVHDNSGKTFKFVIN